MSHLRRCLILGDPWASVDIRGQCKDNPGTEKRQHHVEACDSNDDDDPVYTNYLQLAPCLDWLFTTGTPFIRTIYNC